MKTDGRRVAVLGLATSLALVLSYVEVLLPPLWAAVPGVKLGLPNVVMLVLLYAASARETALVSGLRLLLVALLFGNGMTLMYSVAGAVLSLLTMILLKKTGWFSPVGVSVAGGVAHNAGQILVAIFLLNAVQIGYYMFVLVITGTLAGVLVGLLGSWLLARANKSGIFLLK